MLGLGERHDEVVQALRDLGRWTATSSRSASICVPARSTWRSRSSCAPKCSRGSREGWALGFRFVAAGPLVRSSYKAGEYFIQRWVGKGLLSRRRRRAGDGSALAKERCWGCRPGTSFRAVNDALRIEMRRDPRVVVMGRTWEGSAASSAATVGLIEEFRARPRDRHAAADPGSSGRRIGWLCTGCVRAPRIQFSDFIFPAFDQIVNELAKLRYAAVASTPRQW